MPNDGPRFRDESDTAASRLPGSPPPAVRENLRRAASRARLAAPPADPLGRRRRRWLRRLVGWLARRFDVAADSRHAGAVMDRHYADLLRRVEGDMLMRERTAGPVPEPDTDNAGAVADQASTGTGDGDPRPATRGNRPGLRVVK